VDAREIQDLIDRLESLKKRQVNLLDEQIALTKKVAEAVSQNDEARVYQAGQRDRTSRDRDSDRLSRRKAR
jgi:hypothetical protein